ncbi:MAG: DUF2267 domain-containing protein [Candidatus Methanofastidiosia archaeon]|jgi:uncharacterized protein (DUF2267 family)
MTTGVKSFDRTVQQTNEWLHELMEELHYENQEKVYIALRAVLHAIRDRLSPEEAVQLAAQMPMLVRGFYYEGWTPKGKPVKIRHLDEFLEQIQKNTPGEQIDTDRVARAVFKTLVHRISAGELKDVKSMFPEKLNTLWPD